MPKVLRRPALALAIAACAFCASAPVASANPGDLVASIVAPEATNGVSVAFDGQILYYTNAGDGMALIHRVTPQGVPLPDLTVVGLPPFAGIATLTYDVTRDKFWAVDDLTGREIYLIDKAGTAVLESVITDDQTFLNSVPGSSCGTGICNPLVDGLAFDAQSDTLWWSPDQSHVIYHFDPFGGAGTTDLPDLGVTAPVAQQLGYYRIDNRDNSSMAPYCQEPFSSGIAVGDHGGPDSTGSPSAIMYDFAGPCRFWFKYLGDNDNTPQLLAAYGTFPTPPPPAMNDAEDDECDNVTFNVPVVWVRAHDDNLLRAFQTSTCFLGGGVPIQDKNRMTGGGGLPIVWPATDAGKSAHHGLMIHCFSFIQPDNLEINWGKGNSFHMTSLTTSTCDNDPNATGSSGASFDRIQGSGTGRLNGVPGATATWSFTDNGEPGTHDHGSLMVTTPFGPSCLVPNDPLDFTNGCVVMKADGFLTKDGPLIGEGNYQSHQGH